MGWMDQRGTSYDSHSDEMLWLGPGWWGWNSTEVGDFSVCFGGGIDETCWWAFAKTFGVVSVAWVCRCLCVHMGKSFNYPLGRQALDLWRWYYLSQCLFVVNNIVEKSARKLISLGLKIDTLDNYVDMYPYKVIVSTTRSIIAFRKFFSS